MRVCCVGIYRDHKILCFYGIQKETRRSIYYCWKNIYYLCTFDKSQISDFFGIEPPLLEEYFS